MNEAMPIPAVSQIAERPQTVSATPKMSGAPQPEGFGLEH